jgi:hypothetical protein
LFDSVPEEAEAWAQDFMKKLPLRGEEYEHRREETRSNTRRRKNSVPIVFEFMLETFDARW